MSLPLLQRATEDGEIYLLTREPRERTARMPSRAPDVGEQYRFHVDLGSCIGCKCCVWACNDQNGTPAEINWRRVEEVEGGWHPHTMRGYLSMAATCLSPPGRLSGG